MLDRVPWTQLPMELERCDSWPSKYIYLKYFWKGWWCVRDVLLSSLVGAYMQEDVSSGGGGEARRSTVQGLLWKWFWPMLRSQGTEMLFRPQSLWTFSFIYSCMHIFIYTCMHIFLLWIIQNPTFVDRKNHFMAVPVRHTSQNITQLPLLWDQ